MRYRVLHAGVLACLAYAAPATLAQTSVVTYTLEDVWLLPDITHPWEPAQQMTGTFEWIYKEGDFENGFGDFIELSLPWWGDGLPPLAWTIEQTSLEITLPGKYHDLGVDVTLRYEPLTPDGPSAIDTVLSAFEIQVGVARQGHVISGSVVPVVCPADLDGSGVVGTGDLLILLGAWGSCPGCAADLDGDGVVSTGDLLELLSNWGGC
ncbi:MAG: hypothetical protein ACYS0D_00165 [Planctomycetota bacterium]|jgi:hypothetical protein